MPVNSILLTVFNRPPVVLQNTLNALAMNNLDNCEVVIVDDGSHIEYDQDKLSDSVPAPVRWHRIEPEEYPDWTYTIPHPDGGVINNPSLSMNRGIAEARGKRIIFLSSDCMIPDFGIAEAKKCGDHYWLGNVVDQATNAMLVCDRRPVPFHFFASAKKEHIEAIGVFDENYLRGIAWEDNDFGARLGLYCKHVIFDSGVLVVHQSHDPYAYSDKMAGMKLSEAYTNKKWGGIPWNVQGHHDPVELNTSRDGRLFRCNPVLRDGFPDPLDGKRR